MMGGGGGEGKLIWGGGGRRSLGGFMKELRYPEPGIASIRMER